jgi:hypothetical protein
MHPTMRDWILLQALLLPAMAGGCVGNIGDSGNSSKDPAPPAGAELAAAKSHLMRLTSAEYDNTVRDLLGDTTHPGLAFSPDEQVGPFDANVLAPPSEVMLEQYMVAAEALAATAVQDGAGLTGCTDDLGTDACAERFIDAFGRRAYRRPLSDEQRGRLRKVYADGVALGGFEHGLELVVRAALQSPYFLYRVEIGAPVADVPGMAKLDGYEVASRLSYFLWDSTPDDELLLAAEDGELDAPDGIEREARRLLASPRAAPMVGAFHVQWMGLGVTLQKDPAVFPGFDDALAASVREETARFASDVILSGDGNLATLLTATHTFADSAIGELYGVDRGVDDPAAFIRVELDPAERGGLLTRLGALAASAHVDDTSIVLRGKFVRSFVLCDVLPPPPANVDVSNVTADRTSPTCAGCHNLMDPIGRGLEQYDAIGRFRAGTPSGGEINGTDVEGPFQGGAELSAQLAKSQQVHACVARQWFRFALGRPEDVTLDRGSLAAIDAAFTDGDTRELIVAVALTDAFRFRSVEE